ncbi:MAG: PQQ-binding-like beta-propeller repeat protein [Gammaproteobacteria bacterium]|nr:PQQ-binding-like beta-propeller repeat protein [Gammaproteobacteria bacterium]
MIAWDPVGKREVWRTPLKGSVGSGTLATAGGLVFSGSPDTRWLAGALDAQTVRNSGVRRPTPASSPHR